MVAGLDAITAQAVVPDELIHYVKSVAGLESRGVPGGVMHSAAGHAVLVCYQNPALLEEAISTALRDRAIRHISILAPTRPASAPDDALCSQDYYWRLSLEACQPAGKLANMLRRARREIKIEIDQAWTDTHQKLAEGFCQWKRGLDSGTRFLFTNLGDYLNTSPDTALFSALDADGDLAALAVGDFTPLKTAFYMFAFRRPDAPPGTADLLLWELVKEAKRRGHQQINLGLGVDTGIGFFKKKWGAQAWLPLVETSWTTRPEGFFKKLFGRR